MIKYIQYKKKFVVPYLNKIPLIYKMDSVIFCRTTKIIPICIKMDRIVWQKRSIVRTHNILKDKNKINIILIKNNSKGNNVMYKMLTILHLFNQMKSLSTIVKIANMNNINKNRGLFYSPNKINTRA